MLWAFNLLLLALLMGAAIAVALLRDLLSASIILSGYGLLMAILWTRLSAPDLALIYVALGVCITTIMLVVAVNRTARKEGR